jgi:tripartite-type tricarboxylate transporter receptor subunit TctC
VRLFDGILSLSGQAHRKYRALARLTCHGHVAAHHACELARECEAELLVNAGNAVNATLYDKLNFNFIRDIAPVAGVFHVPQVMEVNPSVPVKTVSEFIAYAEANPGKINMASAGIGSVHHVAGELFKFMTGR